SGGTAPYSYNWSNGSTTPSISGLAANTYFVTVTDNKGCTDIESGVVSVPSPVTAALTSTSVTCNGLSDGSIAATASGGTAGYSYLWSNSLTNSTISGQVAGTYSLTVTDANGCTAVSSQNISEPTALTAIIGG